MKTNNQSGYMLLFIGMDWHKGLSPEQMQKVSEDWMAWFQDLTQKGKAVAGHPLGPEGKVLSGKNRAVTDGPFAESKEAIGGYFLLDVATIDEAVAIARQCPGLPYGVKVEVRPVLSECPLQAKLPAEEQLATAQ
ncbi:MAG TPA: YciI family protein [Verrucomicrobiae bacterium]|nr:YciI family protein [Verrucomicrobiae bacterium]